MRSSRVSVPGIHKAGLQPRGNLYAGGDGFRILDWAAGLSDLHDAHWKWCGYDLCGCGMGPRCFDERSSRFVPEDGQGIPEGAADDPYMRSGAADFG